MQIEIDREVKDFPLCRDGMTGKLCVHNGEVCACNVYAGDEKLRNKFEAR